MDAKEVTAKLVPMVDVKQRAAPNPKVLVGDNHFHIRPTPSVQSIELSPEGLDGLIERSGIPKALASRLSPSTFASVATETLGESSLIIKDSKVISIAPLNNRQPINPERAINIIDKAIPQANFLEPLQMPNYTVRLNILGLEERAVSKGDLIKAGAMVQFSPLGIGVPQVQSYIERLVCTNGLTSNDVIQKFGYGEGDDFWQWLRASTKMAYGVLGNIVTQFQNMQKQKIAPDLRAGILAGLLRRSGIRGDYAEAVNAEAIEAPPQNAYDMLNLITWATSHVIDNPMTIVRSHNAVSNFIKEQEHKAICPMCRQARIGRSRHRHSAN